MNAVRAHSRGFTLVELLVVIAIIAVIASISIPMFARSTFLSGSQLQTASRELYAYLRAAKIYAVDHHVDTAVVYGLKEYDTTLADEPAKLTVGDGLFLARSLSSKEGRALGISADAARNTFVRIKDTEGQYHPMPDGTCIFNLLYEVPGPTGPELEAGVDHVLVYDLEQEAGLVPIPPIVQSPATGAIPDSFPAHRFTSAGLMLSSRTVSTQGVTLKVAPVPSADPQDRTYAGEDGQPGYLGENQPDYRYIGVEIKPSMGRIKIASDKDI